MSGKYVIKKIYNNNIVLAIDHSGKEVVLIGRGIGFQKHVDDIMTSENVHKKFVFDASEVTNRLNSLLAEMPERFLELAIVIVEQAQKELDVVFYDGIYITLSDHINYSIQRYNNNQKIQNAMLWEIKKFYPREFAAALNAINTINYYENTHFDEHEAGFIAVHFLNAYQENKTMYATAVTAEIIKDIIQIIQVHYKMNLDDKTLSYSRLVTHLKYFSLRLLSEPMATSVDYPLFEQVKLTYPNAYNCVVKINEYFKINHCTEITLEEKTYLMLHINRVTKRQG